MISTATWQKDSLQIDGSDGDWTGSFPYADQKLGLAYAVTNDQQNLYIRLTTQTEATIQRILRGGLTLYINNHGVKEELGAAGISFPTGNRIKRGDKLLNDRPELQQDKRIALNAVEDYSLFGFHAIKTPENYDYGKSNPEGIEVGIGLNASNALIYEAMIPLQSFLSRTELNNINRKTVAIGFVLDDAPGAAGGRNGGGGFSIGGGIGLGSFGGGGGLGVSIGSGALANIGGKKKGKQVKIWREMTLTRQ